MKLQCLLFMENFKKCEIKGPKSDIHNHIKYFFKDHEKTVNN